MPLSEEELRLLEQMEKALAAEDPKFVHVLEGRTIERAAKLRTFAAAVVFLGGLAMLLGGVLVPMVWLSVLGFLVMVGSATLGLASWRGRRHPLEPAPPADPWGGEPQTHGRFEVIDGGRRDRHLGSHFHARRTRNHGRFMRRVEERWQRRRDQGYY